MSTERTIRRPGHGADHSAALDAELREEFELHLELLRECERLKGASEAEAAAAALRRFGNPDRYAVACRRVMQGDWIMAKKLLIAWNVVLTIGLVFTFVVASRWAWGHGQTPAEQRATLLKSIWRGEESGMVQVKGKVARPGQFATSTTQPLTLAQLITQAGGPEADAKIVAMLDPELECEGYTTVKAAMRPDGDHNQMPKPGTVITVK